MKERSESITRYYREYTDEFVESNNQNKKLPARYKWIHKGIFYKFCANIVYGIACVFGFIYTRIVLHIKIENRDVLMKANQTGFFLYGNHTQPVGDVFAPSQYIFPRRMYAVASVANLGIPVIGKLLPMLGALIVPTSLEHMKEFQAALRYHIDNKKCIVIYPEAHVWPYCNFIRPFPITSFRFPVALNVPSYCMTTTYQKRRFGKKPKITVYIDGPFYVNHEANARQEQIRLHDEIYECMKQRSKSSTYEYIRYEKVESE